MLKGFLRNGWVRRLQRLGSNVYFYIAAGKVAAVIEDAAKMSCAKEIYNFLVKPFLS
jgi:hypothetical protein